MEKYIAIYARKSKYTEKGESINNQIEKCKNYLKLKYGNENKMMIYSDEGFTGYNLNRPKFKELLNDIKNKKIKTITVYKLDRISRNVKDFLNLKELLNENQIDFISVTEQFDTTTPLGNAMLMISSVFAQLERDTIAERIRDNMYDLAKTGRWLGGNTPLGYKSIKTTYKIDSKNKSSYKLEKIDEEAEIIKLLFNKFIELKGISKLESYLIKNNIKTRKGNYFSRFTLINILKNPVYVIADKNIIDFFKNKGAVIYNKPKQNHGLIAYNKRLEKKGKAYKEKDIKDWIISIGMHEGIIASKKYIETINILEKNKSKRLRIPRKNNSILSGIIKCKNCNSYMRPKLRKTYNKNKRNFSYICQLKEKSRKKLCACKNIDGITTDKLIIQKIKEIKINPKLLKKHLSKKQIETEINPKTKYKNNKIKIKNLIEKLTYIDKDLENEIIKKIKEIEKENKLIEKRIKKQKVKDEEILNNAYKIIKNHMNLFDKLETVNQKHLISNIIDTIEYKDSILFIHYKDIMLK